MYFQYSSTTIARLLALFALGAIATVFLISSDLYLLKNIYIYIYLGGFELAIFGLLELLATHRAISLFLSTNEMEDKSTTKQMINCFNF